MAIALLALPAITVAKTYQFIDTSGNIQSIEANTPQEAIDTAYKLGIHSGVILVDNNSPDLSSPTNTNGSDSYYNFIDTSGNLQGLWAANSSDAIDEAYQRGIHSGVIFVK